MLQRFSRWFRPSTFAVVGVMVALIAAGAHPLPGRYRFGAELLVYVLLGLACASWAPLRRVVSQLGWPRLAVLAAMFAIATGVQLRKIYGPAYPFVSWTMYATPRPPPLFIRYDVVLASGREIPFPLVETGPGTSSRAFLTHFNRRMRGALDADLTVDPSKLGEVERLLSEVAGVYNARNAADPIRDISAALCSIPIRDYQGPESLTCDRLLSFRLGGGEQP